MEAEENERLNALAEEQRKAALLEQARVAELRSKQIALWKERLWGTQKKRASTIVATSFVTVLVGVTLWWVNKPSPIIGNWEYRQANSASGTGFDAEGERLEIKLVGNTTTGSYFGLERLGEYLLYTAVNVTELNVSKDSVSFVVPARSFFSTRPKSVADAKNENAGGGTRTQLKMAGQLEGGKLVIHCTSSDNSCPDSTLIFEQGKWNQ